MAGSVARHHWSGYAKSGHPTPRMLETLRAVARLGSTKDAAQALGISQNTVKNTLSILYRRLGVGTMPEAFYALWLRDLWGET